MTQDRIYVGVGVVIENDGKFLCVREKLGDDEIGKGAGILSFPSGHLATQETIQNSAIREVLEETGYTISVTNIIGLYLIKGALGIALRGEITNNTSPTFEIPQDIGEVLWLTKEECFASEMRPANHEILRDWIDGKTISLDYLKNLL